MFDVRCYGFLSLPIFGLHIHIRKNGPLMRFSQNFTFFLPHLAVILPWISLQDRVTGFESRSGSK